MSQPNDREYSPSKEQVTLLAVVYVASITTFVIGAITAILFCFTRSVHIILTFSFETWLATFISLILGAVVSWAIAAIYARKSTQDFNLVAARLVSVKSPAEFVGALAEKGFSAAVKGLISNPLVLALALGALAKFKQPDVPKDGSESGHGH